MRRDIDRDELHALSENIVANGLINPITVRPVGDRFELVAGQRRLLAMRIAGIIRIPCVVRELDDDKALNVMAAENLERREVDVIDEANFIARLIEQAEGDVIGVAKRLNRSEKYVRDRILVASMPDYMQAFLKSGELKIGAALVLIKIEPDEKRRTWVGLAVQNQSTQREVEYWHYQHTIGTLPSAVASDDDIPNAPPGEYRPQLFTCAVDGKEYPATDCQAVFVYRGNLGTLESIRDELNKGPSVS